MSDLGGLLRRLAAQEQALCQVQFLAPRSRGDVRVRVDGLVHTFAAEPADFTGWGIFQALDGRRARLLEEASLSQVGAYLKLLKPLPMRLALPLGQRCWLAYPGNESDARQRIGDCRPWPVHLVEEAAQFDCLQARWDGSAWWFEELDRRVDPAEAEQLRQALERFCEPQDLAVRGLTPEARTAYGLALEERRPPPPPPSRPRRQRGPSPSQARQAPLGQTRGDAQERRLQAALRSGGGHLNRFVDRGDSFTVEWTDSTLTQHSSSIRKSDLSVLSAGVCLSGEDRKFDLQSLVAVVEGFPGGW